MVDHVSIRALCRSGSLDEANMRRLYIRTQVAKVAMLAAKKTQTRPIFSLNGRFILHKRGIGNMRITKSEIIVNML
jgi:hypothetical protein